MTKENTDNKSKYTIVICKAENDNTYINESNCREVSVDELDALGYLLIDNTSKTFSSPGENSETVESMGEALENFFNHLK